MAKAPLTYDTATGNLTHGAAIAATTGSGGATVDSQARTAIDAILVALRDAGIINN